MKSKQASFLIFLIPKPGPFGRGLRAECSMWKKEGKRKNIKDQKLKGVDDVRQSSTFFETWGGAGTIYLLIFF